MFFTAVRTTFKPFRGDFSSSKCFLSLQGDGMMMMESRIGDDVRISCDGWLLSCDMNPIQPVCKLGCSHEGGFGFLFHSAILMLLFLSPRMYSLLHCKHHVTCCSLLSSHFPGIRPFSSWQKRSALGMLWFSILARWPAQQSCALIIWLSMLGLTSM